MNTLFYDEQNRTISIKDIKASLEQVGASDCETLFIHSDVMFGRPVAGFKRKEYLQSLYDTVLQLNVSNIIVPTFTYSFPNKEDYDILNSRTTMGAFNEFIRKLPNRYRTDDPLLSVSVPLSLKSMFDHVSNHSLGNDSALDILHHMKNVKFLFFGADMSECFTYVHYVEKMMDVPYRFDMEFKGNVRYPDGLVKSRTQKIHTQCYGVKLPPKYDYFENEMEEQGYLKKVHIADKYIACLSEEDAYREIKNRIKKDVNYFLEYPFSSDDLIHEYTHDVKDGRITHC